MGFTKQGGLTIDDGEKTVTIDGEYVTVTPTEFGILKLLTENAGKFSLWNRFTKMCGTSRHTIQKTP